MPDRYIVKLAEPPHLDEHAQMQIWKLGAGVIEIIVSYMKHLENGNFLQCNCELNHYTINAQFKKL